MSKKSGCGFRALKLKAGNGKETQRLDITFIFRNKSIRRQNYD
jgi:hypothetical protein